MKKPAIVHILNSDKFVAPFIEFSTEHINNFSSVHLCFVTGNTKLYLRQDYSNVIKHQPSDFLNIKFIAKLFIHVLTSKKIIVHGLVNQWIIKLLALVPFIGPKLFWVILGGDLHAYKNRSNWKWWRHEIFRILLIKKIKNYITHVEEDVKLANKWYQTNGIWHNCFIYPSNLFYSRNYQLIDCSYLQILVGNSADPTNNHIDILSRLKEIDSNNNIIYCPLSYGNMEYANHIITLGNSLFGDRFIPIKQFLTHEDYLRLLARVDIAIFNHKRQQALGNITTLLGFGKKVYLNPVSPQFKLFSKLGIYVYSNSQISLDLIDNREQHVNTTIISQHFSKHNLKQQWENIYHS